MNGLIEKWQAERERKAFIALADGTVFHGVAFGARKDAVGEALGMKRAVRLDVIPDPKLGDYVMVHAGFAIERLPQEQALDDLETWEELKDALR